MFLCNSTRFLVSLMRRTGIVHFFFIVWLFGLHSLFAQVNNCLDFDGVNDYVELTLNNNLENKSAFSVEMWVSIASVSSEGLYLFDNRSDATNRISISPRPDGSIMVGVCNGGNSEGLSAAGTITFNRWYHIAMVFDGAGSDNAARLKLYVDGIQIALTFPGAALPASTSSSLPTARLCGSSPGISVKMDEVRVWYTDARTQNEIKQYMNTTLGTRSGLLASYHFDEGTAGGNNAGVTTLNDKSGDVNHSGTLINFTLDGASSNWVSRVYPVSQDNCLKFDGTDDYVNLGNLGTEIDDKTALTVEMWCNAAAWTQDATLFSKYFSSTSRTQIQLHTSGNFLLTVEQGTDAVVSQAYTTTAPATAGEWFHLAMVFDGTGGTNAAKLKLYINGQAVPLTYNGTINADLNSTVQPALLGVQGAGESGSLANYFSGLMDEVRIWNVTRTQITIQQNMFTPLAGTESGLVAYYNFNQGSAASSNSLVTVLNDVSVENNWNWIANTAAKNFGVLTNFALTGSTSNWVASTFILGSGTIGDPYQVANLNHLYWIEASTDRWNKYYLQTANIDASSTSTWDGGAGWIPVGNEFTKFLGRYNGDGHTITGLTINRPSTDYIGFFGMIAKPSTITNLGLVNVSIIGRVNTGGLSGVANGTSIVGCYTTGSVTGTQNVGGLAGHSLLITISDCYSKASVSGTSEVGGFTGNVTATVSNSYSTGLVTASTSTSVGGFAGYSSSTTANNLFWDTQTSGKGTSAIGTGKTTAQMKDITTYTNAPWDFVGCTPTWNKNTGRNNDYPFLQWQYPTDTPASIPPTGSGTSGSPHLIANINNLLWIGGDAARLSLYYRQTANLDLSCSNTWNAGSGWEPIGSFTTPFTGSYNGDGHTITGLTINRPSTHYVGFFGYTGSPCSITNLGLVTVSVRGASGPGGLGANIEYSSVSNCYITGTITGTHGVGGLAGIFRNTTITNCYSRASVSGGDFVGGFAASFVNSAASYSYSTGSVTALYLPLAGGFVGTQTNSTAEYSFWDTQTSNITHSALGTGKTTAEMKLMSTFTGWNSALWRMDAARNDNYPYLAWQYADGTPLPVQLTSFSATVTGSAVSLHWQTATEVSNYGFEIEKAVIGNEASDSGSVRDFHKIGFVEGNGNSNKVHEYSFTDDNATSGKALYRLKQIDTDGTFSYSNEVEVLFNGIPTAFALDQNYPNPFNPSTTIKFALPFDSKVVIKIYNSLGQEVSLLKNDISVAGNYELQFQPTGLPSGVYFYHLQAESVTNNHHYSSVKKMILLK